MNLKMYLSDLRGKRVTVIGAGVSNRPLILMLLKSGISVTVCDRSCPEALGSFLERIEAYHPTLRLGEHYLDDLSGDIVFRTPGMHPQNPALVKARTAGSIITSEMEVFLSLCPCRVIAVTGSDGKTTTATLISELLTAAGKKVWLGGNIGRPLLSGVDAISPEDVAVIELSSFQLHSMTCAPDVAVVTNIAPNHLDIHPSYEDYIRAKKQIFINQKPDSVLVLNRDNAITASFAPEARGTVRWFSRQSAVDNGFYLQGTEIRRADGQTVLDVGEILIPGVHNVENYLAAFCAVDGLVSPEVFHAVARRFPGVPHRLETVRVLRGVTFINDSIASSPSRTIAGLTCLPGKVILIAGGKDKGLSFDSLGDEICRHVKKLFLTGFTAQKLKASVMDSDLYAPDAPEITVIDDFSKAIYAAAAAAEPGDTVLLSPACTSFDHFKNFEERGNTFRGLVEGLV